MIDRDKIKQHGIRSVTSGDLLQKNKVELIKQIKKLLPRVIDSDGHLNVKTLQELVNISGSTSNNQGYELTFAGKGYARYLADTPTEHELKTESKQSKDFNNTSNMVIRGDNLEALKILYQNYYGKVKMIYIDPPYNTQSEEFIYRDNFKVSDEKLIEDFGMDEDAKNFLHNIYGTGAHSGWLSFMYPRLKLARELLTEDGVIFISIDDHEQAGLKMLCDEIFGEGNCICDFIWLKRSEGGLVKDGAVINRTENILLYSKNKKPELINKIDNVNVGRVNWRDFRKSGGEWQKHFRPNQHFPFYYRESDGKLSLESLSGSLKITPQNKDGVAGYWENNRLTTSDRLSRGELRCRKKGSRYQIEQIDIAGPTKSVGSFVNIPSTQGSQSIKELFEYSIFNNPKPIKLIELLGKIGSNKDSIILDFFAGSGTTGDAVMQLNAEDGGSRKFILVQLDEPIDESNKNMEAHKFCKSNKMQPVISSITIERLNRAGEKLKQNIAGQNGKKGHLINDGHKSCPDIGYKVYSLVKKPEVYEQGGIFKASKARKKLDTLANMLCVSCKPLDTPIEEIQKDVIYKADDAIYILAQVTVKELKEIEDIDSLAIKLDGWADIDIESMLNLDESFKENLTVIY